MTVFIPPKGAMQFHVTQGWRGTPVPDHLSPMVIWVMPPRLYPEGSKQVKPDCPHKFYYPVIREALAWGERMGSGVGVCECVGHLIE